MDNITAYKELETELASKLEAQYQYLMFNGDITGAYNILGRMMSYKLIDRTDERLDKKFKVFQKVGIDKDHRFRLDLRKDTNYIPDWLFADIPPTIMTNLVCQRHLVNNTEAYGDTSLVASDRKLKVRISLVNTPKKAENIAEDIIKLNTDNKSKGNNLDILKKELTVGFARVYEISIADKFIEKYRILGYVILYKNVYKNGFTSWIALKHNILKLSYIDIKSAYKIIGQALKNGFKTLDNLSLKILINPSNDCKEQELYMVGVRDEIASFVKEKDIMVEADNVIKIEKAREKEEKAREKELRAKKKLVNI